MTFPEIPIPASYGAGGAKLEEEYLLEKIYSAVSDYQTRIQELELDLDTLEDSDAVMKYAHLEAFNTVQELALGFLLQKLKEATVSTVEYNIPIFTTHMEEAIRYNQHNLITLVAEEPGEINVNINMYHLGDPEEYASAVRVARSELGIGKIPDPEVRSHIWEEKIYGTEREGRKIEHPKTGEDITDRYIGLYTQTIVTRLSEIGPDKAPWWYFINYGNLDMFAGEVEEEGGAPYPVIEPTYFVNKAIVAIESAFEDVLTAIVSEAELVYSDLLYNDYDIEGVAGDTSQIIDEVADVTLEEILKKAEKAPTHKTIDVIEHNETQWELYITSTGKIGRRYSLAKNR
jgi:hypothetical protein